MCPFSRQRGNSIYFLLFLQNNVCTVDQVTISQLFAINNVVTVLQTIICQVYTVHISHVSDSRSGKGVINKKIKSASTNTRHIKTDVIIRPVLAYHSNKLAHPRAWGETPEVRLLISPSDCPIFECRNRFRSSSRAHYVSSTLDACCYRDVMIVLATPMTRALGGHCLLARTS